MGYGMGFRVMTNSFFKGSNDLSQNIIYCSTLFHSRSFNHVAQVTCSKYISKLVCIIFKLMCKEFVLDLCCVYQDSEKQCV